MTSPVGSGSAGADASGSGSASTGGGGLLGALGLPDLLTAIQTWVNSIQSGFAHFVDVWFNNVFYFTVATFGGVLIAAGLIVFISGTGPVKAIGKAATLGAFL